MVVMKNYKRYRKWTKKRILKRKSKGGRTKKKFYKTKHNVRTEEGNRERSQIRTKRLRGNV